jgi:hypothetical protein
VARRGASAFSVRLAGAGMEDLAAGEVLLPGISRKYIVAGGG